MLRRLTAAATAAIAGDTQIGRSRAFIPSFVMPNLYRLADKKYRDNHRYYIDSSPVVGDVCTANCSNAGTAVCEDDPRWRPDAVVVATMRRISPILLPVEGALEFSDTNMATPTAHRRSGS